MHVGVCLLQAVVMLAYIKQHTRSADFIAIAYVYDVARQPAIGLLVYNI